jgi:hypothetical protein
MEADMAEGRALYLELADGLWVNFGLVVEANFSATGGEETCALHYASGGTRPLTGADVRAVRAFLEQHREPPG